MLAAEYLCERYGIPCTNWASTPTYTLSDPWFTGLEAHKQEVLARLLQETPEPFARRSIYCGNRMFANKYELAKHSQGLSPPRLLRHLPSPQNRHSVLASRKEEHGDH